MEVGYQGKKFVRVEWVDWAGWVDRLGYSGCLRRDEISILLKMMSIEKHAVVGDSKALANTA